MLTIIVCTYGRPKVLGILLDSLSQQTSRNFELLIVYAGADCVAGQDEQRFRDRTCQEVPFYLIRSHKGLPVQRNVGLERARGDVIAFLDDDITVDASFVSSVLEVFEWPGMKDVGGITGYDDLHYGTQLAVRYRVRNLLGYYPDLRPGAIGLCNCTVPLSFQPAFSGFREIHWLPGFCMIYRRQAVGTQRFDEVLPAYGTEDGIFSMAIGRRWRLLMWGDLHVRHHADPTSRCTPAEAIYGGSFSLSRNHWLETGGAGKPLRLARYALCEFVLDLAIFLRRPNRTRVVSIAAKQLGLVKGAMSAIFNARHYPDLPEMSR